jgi:hypothetical protein
MIFKIHGLAQHEALFALRKAKIYCGASAESMARSRLSANGLVWIFV